MLSIIVPLFNECESLAELHGEIAATLAILDRDAEIIFVDDGSRDGSWRAIRALTKGDSAVRGLRLRRNFGKSAALAAGFRAARGDTFVTIDADLQDDPREIPRLVAALDGELDLVNGWKKDRRDPWHKVWPSRLFNALVGRMSGLRLHDHNCGLKALRSQVAREINLYGGLHRFIPVLAAARGFRVGEIAVNHRPRRHGKSKYGVARFLTGFVDLLTVKFLTSFGRRPQHLLGSVGLFAIVFGSGALTYLAGTWIVRLWAPDRFPPIHERALLGYAIAALLFGTQLMSIGFLADLVNAASGRDAGSECIAEEI